MKILFDHQVFDYVYGGASKYFAMLLNYMPKDTWDTTTLCSSNEYIKANHLFKTYKYYFKGQTVLSELLNRPYTNYCLRKQNFDVFHQTNFGTYCLKSLGDKPMVTTYHDSNLSTLDPHPEIVKHQKNSLERADAIICVSENTKQDMLNIFALDEKRVNVIYHGIEIPDLSKLTQQKLFSFPYILYVGRRSKYKNFSRFIRAFSLLHHKYNEIKVVCTSSLFSNEEMELFKKLDIYENIINIPANEQMMLRLYRDALFFVYPSLYEGFGMPILEAWSCHCPVALSNASCFPEIAKNAGLYFDPNDEYDIYTKMLQLVENEKMRMELINNGNSRIKKFSWQKCANKHIEVYKSLID
jgi:glycosyltransferase involved in cell wall biosynthesis